MKYSAVLALALLAAFVAISDAQSNNYNFGNIGPGDRLLHREIVMKKSKMLRVVTTDYTFPPKGSVQGSVITGIKIFDQYQNGKGGSASLTSGGPGAKEVTIHLKSQRGHGFNFIVEIYGH